MGFLGGFLLDLRHVGKLAGRGRSGERERERQKRLELARPCSDQTGMSTRNSEPCPQRRRIHRWLASCLLGACVTVTGAGCQVPRYQFPGGYSSTYARHLHADDWTVPLPEAPPPVESDSQPPGVFYPQAFKYQPPTRSEFQRTVIVLPEDRPATRRRY